MGLPVPNHTERKPYIHIFIMKRLHILTLALMSFVALASKAQSEIVFISCLQTNGYVGLGSYHSATPYIFYVTNGQTTEDLYWRKTQTANGYTFQNVATGQYLSFTTERNGNICKYMTLVDEFSGDNELWNLQEYSNASGYYTIQSVANNAYYWNLRSDGTGLVGTYAGNYRTANEAFLFTTAHQETALEKLQNYMQSTFPNGVNATTFPMGDEEGLYSVESYQALYDAYQHAQALVSNGGSDAEYTAALENLKTAFANLKVNKESFVNPEARYIYFTDGRVVAYPTKYISREAEENGQLVIETNVGVNNSYSLALIDSVSLVAPKKMPGFSSYKFNNKYNDQVFTDCIGTINGDTVNVSVGAIGKRLTPSFNFTDERAAAYINGVEQVSKKSRLRFDKDIVYLIANHGWQILSPIKVRDAEWSADGKTLITPAQYNYGMKPLGKHVVVRVDWLTDHPTGFPSVYINTSDGQNITSKKEYKEATIRIDGGGVFPDMAETPVLIRGRGNSSWSSASEYNKPKNPYRLKFDSKQKPFGMTKGKSWVLLANKQTNSMTTNAIGYKVANLVGAAGANHVVPVDFYLNGEYRGNYNFTEKTGFSNNSIDLADETKAAFLELDSYFDETYRFKSDNFQLPVNIKEPEFADATTVTSIDMNTIEHSFNEMENIVASGEDYSSYIDVEMLTRFLVANEIIRNQELSHPKSVFLYREDYGNSDSKYVFGPVWDCDWAYGYDGSYRYFLVNAATDFYDSFIAGRPGTNLFQALRHNEDVIGKTYYKVWSDFMDGGFAELIEFVQDYYDFAKPSLEHNATVWYGDGTNYATTTENAKQWLTSRINYAFSNLTPYDISDLATPDSLPGDVNEDGLVTVADVVCIINNLTEQPSETFNFKNADIDGNELITVADAVGIISIVLRQPAPALAKRLQLPLAEASLELKQTATAGAPELCMPFHINIEEGNYKALQIDIRVPQGTCLTDLRLAPSLVGFETRLAEIGTELYRVSLLSTQNALLPAGSSILQLELHSTSAESMPTGTVSISNALLSSDQGEEHRIGGVSARIVADTQSGIRTASESVGQKACYDLTGRKVNKASKGIYIINGKKIVK